MIRAVILHVTRAPTDAFEIIYPTKNRRVSNELGNTVYLLITEWNWKIEHGIH